MLDAIRERRSCRSFQNDKKLSKEQIENIVKAALNAPTGVDFQSYDYIVCTNQEKLDEVAQIVYDTLKEGKYAGIIKSPKCIFYGAPCVIFIVPSREFREDCYKYDLGTIGDTICLAAQLQGLSSLHVGFVMSGNAEKLGKVLDLPRGLAPLAVAVGYKTDDYVPHEKPLTSKIKYID